jgi:prophage regulatory protein
MVEQAPAQTERLIRFAEVKRLTGIDSRQQAQNLVRMGIFPKPVSIGLRAIAWVESEIAAWRDARIVERDAQRTGRRRAGAAESLQLWQLD